MKNFSFAQRGVVLACAAACASYAANSFAQTSTEAQLKPIIVTASRMEQALQTAPVGATVILGDGLRSAGALDANEALRRLGGIVSRPDLMGGREANLDIRGFGEAAANNMVVVIDGVRISQNEIASARLSAITADRIERIEIVRGGASVAWGEGATAGVINIVTRGADAKGLSGAVQLGLESFGTRDASANLNVGMDNARLYAHLRSLKSDGYRDNSAMHTDSMTLGVQAGALGAHQQGLQVRLELFQDKQSARLPGALPIAAFLINPKQTNTPLNFASFNEDRVTAAARYKRGPWLASLDLAHRDRAGKSFYDYGAGGDQADSIRSDQTQISPRLHYNADLAGTALQAQLGMDRQSWHYKRDVLYSGFAGGDETATQKSRATFARLDALLPSQTRLVLGLRNERIRKAFTDPLAFALTSYQQNDPLKAWEFGVNQTIAAGWDAYVRSSRSYRVGNVDENRNLPAPLKPQQAHDLELGLRQSSASSSFGVRVFRQKTQDEIVYDNSIFSNINIDPVQRTGVEIEGRTQLARAWTLSGSLQSIRARFSTGAYAGKRVPHVPELSAQARLAWQADAVQRLELALNHRGAAILGNDLNNACALREPSLTTIDVQYNYSLKSAGWHLSAGVDNFTDRKTFGWGITNAACSATNVYPESGRSFKLKARYSF
jgi:iron complex outermembrane recepter protein